MSKAKIKVPSPPATAKKAGKEPPSPFPPPENGLPDGLTSEWMTGALRHHGHITDKTTLKISRVGDIYNFNGVVFRVQVSYHGTQAGLPSSFVLKMAPNNPASARREVLFYNSLLPAKPLNENLQVPLCYWAGVDVKYRCDWSPDGIVSVPDGQESPAPSRPSTAEGTCAAMLMDDVGEHDIPTLCGFGNPNFDSWHHGNILFEDAKLVVSSLAILHGKWWGSPELLRCKYPPLAKRRCYRSERPPLWELLADKWGRVASLFQKHAHLNKSAHPPRTRTRFPHLARMNAALSWPTRRARPGSQCGCDPQNSDRGGRRRYGGVEAMKGIAMAAPITLQHGDLRPPNFRVEGEKVYLFDWAELNAGSAAEELANYIDSSNFYDKSFALIHGKAFQLQKQGPVASHESPPVVKELLQTYYASLSNCGVDAAKYPFKTFIDHFCVSTILLNAAEMVQIEGINLAEHIPEMDTRFQAVLQMLETLAAEFS